MHDTDHQTVGCSRSPGGLSGGHSSQPAEKGRYYPTAKRLLDIFLSVTGLVLFLPLWILIGLAIKLEDGGPVFFTHRRMGLNGEPFDLLKFRSMTPNNSLGPSRERPDNELITSIGAALRRTALDEAPQLINILRGDMSFVGPRPLNPWDREADLTTVPGFRERHTVRPGLTGLAQLHTDRNDGFRRRFRYDQLYMRSRSVVLDILLIVKSLGISLAARWE